LFRPPGPIFGGSVGDKFKTSAVVRQQHRRRWKRVTDNGFVVCDIGQSQLRLPFAPAATPEIGPAGRISGKGV
jgi:hypothetical protein